MHGSIGWDAGPTLAAPDISPSWTTISAVNGGSYSGHSGLQADLPSLAHLVPYSADTIVKL
jgi:hypothetical protein